MQRPTVTLMVVAVIAATLVGVSSAAARTNQAYSPPGNDGTAGLTKGPVGAGDFDGDGSDDAVALYYDSGDGRLVTQVTLANGYKTFYESVDAQGPIASFFKIKDIDRDSDDEILVSVFPQSPQGPVELYALAGCDLVKAGGPGEPFELNAGPGSLFPIGLDCFAPSAAGKGMTQYVSQWDLNFENFTVARTEYRLKVSDATGTADFTQTRETTTILKASNPGFDELADYASSVHCGAAPKCDGKRATIQGTPFKDKLVGSAGKDIVVSLGGADNIATKAKADLICAGAGNDTITAGSGGDSVFGQAGSDVMNGGTGADILNGGTGKDTAKGGPGKDTCLAETKSSC